MRLQVPILQTERLVLEPLTLSHSSGMYNLWSRPEVCEYSGDAVDVNGNPIRLPAKSISDSNKIIEFFTFHQRAGTGLRWAAMTKASSTFVGALGFNSLGRQSELAYHLHPDFWGSGLMSEACQAAMSWVTAVHGSDAVEAYVDPQNAASVRLLERLEFHTTGGARDGAALYIYSSAVA
jgi:ribosomal-protein-alanine N-acetyltransferase